MDYRQVAERLGVSASTAYLMIREGGRGFFPVQADGTVQAEDLEAFVLEAVYGLTTVGSHSPSRNPSSTFVGPGTGTACGEPSCPGCRESAFRDAGNRVSLSSSSECGGG
jgi:hypothetical protein